MFSNTFYHNLIRKYVIGFGNLFNDISIQRMDSNGNRVQTLSVPIGYGPKQAYLVRIGQNPNLRRQVAVQLPRIGFEITAMNYAPDRKIASTKKYKVTIEDEDKARYTYVPVPYDIQFTLSIFVKNADDGAQIVEQILPYFTPEWTVTMNLVEGMGLNMDIPYTLQSVDLEDTYENDFMDRRALVWNMDFTCKGYFYGPERTAGVIKRAQTDLHGSMDGRTNSRIVMTPGLTANGTPTEDPNESIDHHNISYNDDYGFAQSLDFFLEGVDYDPESGDDEL